jgi:hypothetical protein
VPCGLTFVSLISFNGRFLLLTGTRSIASRVESAPSMTLPKMVYFPSKWSCLPYVMKNWDLFVSGPELAIATMPRALNWEASKERGKAVSRRQEREGEDSWSTTQKVGIALVSHFDGGSDFVLERLSPDRLATLPQTNGITGLDHESLDVAVENATVVIVGSTKGQKVLRHGARVNGCVARGERAADVPLLLWARPRRTPRS